MRVLMCLYACNGQSIMKPNNVYSQFQMNGRIFEGDGPSKKKAKLMTAEKALASFLQFPNAAEVHHVLGRNITTGDFTSDKTDHGKTGLGYTFT